jgi:hypothetical protein
MENLAVGPMLLGVVGKDLSADATGSQASLVY